ncbi:MAG: hypothetical protein WAW36_18970 [Methylovulum miyakonense]|uniref:hypothetical protein n=1 Tax=Methylovulum miyakonense TaxID=645578 RepID=UPI003BB4FCE7
MNDEERWLKLTATLQSQRDLLKKLASETLALRAFAQAVLEQPTIDLDRLHADYLEFLDQAVAQLPPNLQDEKGLELLRVEMEAALSRRRRA